MKQTTFYVELFLFSSTIQIFNDSIEHYGLDLPNMLFCAGHAGPIDLKELYDPESWAI